VNSKKLAVIGLILVTLSATSAPVAQINLDTTYATTGIRPFDEPINPNLYLIRPGEQFEVVFLGAKLPSLLLKVNAEGRLVHAELGLFELAGLTLTQTRTILLESLQRLYRADEIVISINSIYPVAIQVSGMVNRPGTYVGYTSQRVSEMIDSAGGVAPGGSTRRISFQGESDDIAVDLDLYQYASDRSHNPCLYSGYRVYVPSRTGADVQVVGAVVEPRAIELLPGENVADMIRLAGGTLPGADISIARLINDSDKSLTPMTQLQAGDVVIIPETSDIGSKLQVQLFGFVSRPGLYEYTEGLTLAELLNLAGGSGPESNSDRITVFRLSEKDGLGWRPVGRYPLMPVDVDRADRLMLRPGDSVFVPRLIGYVIIAGLVDHPGLVPYTSGHNVENYIRLAGGFIDPDNKPSVDLSDRISGLTRPATMRTVVYDGDIITVRRGDEN